MPAIYQAECWCDKCADEIKSRLLADATDEQKEDWEDESAYDSDEFPKYMSDDQESDSPCHCAAGEECLAAEVLASGLKIGALLSTSLTSEGAEYVKQAVSEGGEVAEFWRNQFSWIDFPSDEEDEEEASDTTGCFSAE